LLTLWMLPFFSAIVIWALGPQLRRAAGVLGSAAVLLSFVLACALFGVATAPGGLHVTPLIGWAPGFTFGLLLDPLSLVWVLIITGVGGLIHLYSIGYMAADKAVARFFAYLNFFVFAMLTLVLSDNLVGLLVGWGLVGVASYFLIGFWFYKPSAVAAALKAFVINVFGDVGLMYAIFVLYGATGSIAYADVFAKAASLPSGVILTACIALFIAAAAKSAQVPLQTWLPDAMEGPTPVSALIHAATMVTAGVYLIARFAPLWNASPQAQELVGTIGAVTALLAAILGTAQWDIKRILAYSTMSQIGYMIMGVGVGAYEAGVLHFFTHAFFKAQLFLGAGLVIHALHEEQDIRKMGGLRRRTPFAFVAMAIGTLAIIGVPGFSGFYSKDAVIYGTLEHGHPLLYAAAVVTAGITAYYMFRMLFVAFGGHYRGEVPEARLGMAQREPSEPVHAREGHVPDWVMQIPVGVLIVGSIGAGYLAIGGAQSPWWRFLSSLYGGAQATAPAPISELLSSLIVLAIVIAGVAVAYYRYGTRSATASAVERLRGEALRMPAVLTNAFYFDAAIELLFVRPARRLGALFAGFVDPAVIDAGVRDVVWLTGAAGYLFRALQTGLVRGYALTIVASAACFVAWFVLTGAAR
jgi:NADH-quinone oxidoreductase subunit L